MKNIGLAYIDGKRLAWMANDDIRVNKLKEEDILELIVNLQEIVPMLKLPGKMFKGAQGKELAAVCIQSAWRMHKSYRAYQKLKVFIQKAVTIQRAVRKWKNIKDTRNVIGKQRDRLLKEFERLQQNFRNKWQEVKEKPRIEIHINS